MIKEIFKQLEKELNIDAIDLNISSESIGTMIENINNRLHNAMKKSIKREQQLIERINILEEKLKKERK